ncbi:MAG: aquaporin [Xanthobacteraceae bacterium]|jgi:aquaporin Z
MGGNTQKYLAEVFGTAVLVLIGCATIVAGGIGGAMPLGIFPIGMAFGMTVTAMAFTIGPVSGCHLNPSVTAAVWASGRMSTGEAIGYIIAQIAGAIIGAAILYVIMKGKVAGYDVAKQGLGQNGWSDYSLGSAMLAEFVGTLIFTIVILAVTGPKGTGLTAVAGLIIGITLMVMHLAFIPVSGSSLNGARSLGPAVFVGGTALSQVWMYLVVPTIAGAVAGWLVKSKTLDV